jgi:aminoglycoside N3'-acetyltransferase
LVFGDHVALGLSFKSIGRVLGGPASLVDALLEVVGPNGTIVVPTYTNLFPLPRVVSGATDYVFDRHTTDAYTGLFPNTVWRISGAVRSKHPTNSMAAIGQAAHRLLDDHGPGAGAYSPYSTLGELAGKVLCIGIGDNLVGIRHQAQALAGLLHLVPYRLGVKYRDDAGGIKLFRRPDKGGCTTLLPLLVAEMRETRLIRDGQVGQAKAIIGPAAGVLRFMVRRLEKSPESFLCQDIACLWCREVERRLRLYSKIPHPSSFQSSWIKRQQIAFDNWLRLRYLEGK